MSHNASTFLQSYKDSIDPAKVTPSTSTAPSYSTPSVPPPSRAAVEEDDENYFQSLQQVTRRKIKAKETKETEANPAATEENDPAKTTEEQPSSSPHRDPAPEAEA